MKFEEALAELRKGKKIRHKSWGKYYYLEISFLDDSWEILEEPGKSFPEVFESFKSGKRIRRKIWCSDFSINNITGNFPLGTDDILATDWEIIE